MLFWVSSPSGHGLTSNTSDSEQLGQFSFGLSAYSTVVVLVNLKLWFQVKTCIIFKRLNIYPRPGHGDPASS
jgi:hypothetical protein